MKYTFLLTIIFCLTAVSGIWAQETACESLVWFDEFDTEGVPSTAKWNYDSGGGGWGNNELQTYTNTRTNSWVENGRLYIKAVKTNGSWTSARLITRDKGDWLYGRIEVKAKLPSGKGTWPAIWMLPTDWEYGGWPQSGEIDIMEHVGYDPGVVHGTIHTEAYNHSIGTQKGGSTTVTNAMSTFHVYAIEWTAETIKWYVDDELYFTFKNEHKTYREWPFDQRFHLLLNIAIGGDWGGAQGIDPKLAEATMEIDYVRIYSNKLPKPEIQGATINSAGDEVTYSTDVVPGAQYQWIFPTGVTVLSGEGTSSVTVQWNDVSGDIQVEMKTNCDAVVSDLFHVACLIKPDTEQLDIFPLNENLEMQWKIASGADNRINLSEENDDLVVDFQVTNPSQNPYVHYNFDGLVDLSDLSHLVFDLKVDPANPPSNMRIDLVDVNGSAKLSNLFKIDSFESDDAFHTYSHLFTENDDGSFLLGQIAQIRIYFNYGIFGKPGNGSFQLRDVRLQVPNNTAVDDIFSGSQFNVFPIPAKDFLNVTSSSSFIQRIELYSVHGNVIRSLQSIRAKNYTFNLRGLTPGIYFLKINQSDTRQILIR